MTLHNKEPRKLTPAGFLCAIGRRNLHSVTLKEQHELLFAVFDHLSLP